MATFKNYLHGLFVLGALCALPAFCADVVVVVSAKSPVSTLTADQVSQLFLGKLANFPGGGVAIPIDQAESSAIRDEFYTKVTSKTAAQIKAYWSKLIFTGKGQPPKEVKSSADVKRLVSANPNVIGYIDRAAVDATVKIVWSH